ncbi:MAG: HD-GYP domain-containing protein, partial [Ruminiclostridium sp.]|nr:HD-GYP domain-containing protein [Ruminiclostridium sp.]
DYFVYFPNADIGEMPIGPKQPDSDKDSSVRVGFIMYAADKTIDYAANYEEGELRYRLQTSILKNPLFWVLGGMTIIWISCLLAMIIVKVNLKRFIEQKKRDEIIIEQTMQTFVNFIEAKDPSTMGHSLRVAKYSKMLAEKLGFSEEECNHIHGIALMHDCGKIYIPDEILSKPGKLTDEEYEIMKKHTVYGSEILRDFTAIEGMGTGALCHHERYDGKGYPNGIAGEEIPLIARIIGVSDAFDAMNSRRCYRSSLSAEVILSELKNNKGKQFDPDVIECLLSLIESGEITWAGNENHADS